MVLRISTIVLNAAILPFVMLTYLDFDDVYWPEQTTLIDESVYDYIVVGVGTAGSVVATRLAESNNSVLALEYGDDPPFTALLAGFFAILPHSDIDYSYTATYDPYASKAQNNYTILTAGKTLGGSSTLNHFIHTRGPASDFDKWAEIANDDSWKYEKILDYFIKSEKVNDKEIIQKYPEYHGRDGPIGLTRQTHHVELRDYFTAFEQAGNPIVLDVNADKAVGITNPQFTIARHLRQTPAYSYLKRVLNNDNLHVSKNTRVKRIIFENNVAVAVEAIHEGNLYTLRANKEIILSAGAFNTPQILMLSGVGPEDHLQSMNIPVIKNMPVGDNLIDQIAVIFVHKTKKYLLTKLETDISKFPFPLIVGNVALNKSDFVNPDYQMFSALFARDSSYLGTVCRYVFNMRNDICDRWIYQVRSRDSLFSKIIHAQPNSRGNVRLKSTDPFDDPEITLGHFTAEQDLEEMLLYLKDFIRICNTTSFLEMQAKAVGLDAPECAEEEFGSDEFWKCYILNRSVSVYHPSSTCPMGTIVDSCLKLKGFDRIRIIDASVMPIVPRSAPNAAVIMLAEKGADMILNKSET